MTQYCSSCRGAFGSLIEMDIVVSELAYADYQCPSCSQARRVEYGLATPVTIEEIHRRRKPSVKPSVVGTIAKVTGALVLGGILINAAGKKARK